MHEEQKRYQFRIELIKHIWRKWNYFITLTATFHIAVIWFLVYTSYLYRFLSINVVILIETKLFINFPKNSLKKLIFVIHNKGIFYHFVQYALNSRCRIKYFSFLLCSHLMSFFIIYRSMFIVLFNVHYIVVKICI